jgi:O-antigen ligase
MNSLSGAAAAPHPPAEVPAPLLIAAAVLAAGVPTLLAYNASPSPTFYNQAAACVGWGAFAALIALGAGWSPLGRRPLSTLAALLLLTLAALGSWWWGALPASLSLSGAGMLLAATVLFIAGAQARSMPQGETLFAAFCWGWLIAGVASALIALLQVFAPDWPDGDWIARSGLPGRAVGNVRQPNHLSSALLWASVAIVPLVETRRLQRALAAALMALLVFAVVLSASRTGMVGVALMAAWGGFDVLMAAGQRWQLPGATWFERQRLSGSLSGFMRVLLLAMPVVYALGWVVLALWAHQGHHAFGGEARLAESDVSGSRFGIWANTLSLIAQQPWLGVGFGEFNFAWTLTPFPGRPTAFFDHTHNLPLQLAVELGVPLALLVMGLLVHALWRAWRAGAGVAGTDGVAVRSAFVMVLMMALHSLLEYPLWYAYFLLPAAWALGFALGEAAPAARRAGDRRLFAAAMLVSAAGVLSVADYWRVVAIFAPADDSGPLPQRITAGQRSVLFSHHADYAAATTTETPGQAMPAFAGAAHYLLDTRLMTAWANAYAERGDLNRARYLAQRLREFHKSETEEFFAACEPKAMRPRPFQCEAPSVPLTWRDFR